MILRFYESMILLIKCVLEKKMLWKGMSRNFLTPKLMEIFIYFPIRGKFCENYTFIMVLREDN